MAPLLRPTIMMRQAIAPDARTRRGGRFCADRPPALSSLVLAEHPAPFLLTPRSRPHILAPKLHHSVVQAIWSCCWHTQEGAPMPYATTSPSAMPPALFALLAYPKFLLRPQLLTR
jgi:hypothetical protein